VERRHDFRNVRIRPLVPFSCCFALGLAISAATGRKKYCTVEEREREKKNRERERKRERERERKTAACSAFFAA
jgi:hypothetical protein